MTDVITGSRGFLGTHLSALLPTLTACASSAYDLRRPAHIEALFKHTGKVDTLYHLAALVGGIGANSQHPGKFFYDNMIMGVQLVHASYLHGVSKFVTVGTVCSYPKFSPIPFREFNLFDGYPEETNAPYGIAKRSLLVMLQSYQQEYGLRYAYVIPTNLYGPGDNFEDSTSHVIPALIKKCLQPRLKCAKYHGMGYRKSYS
jgi:GDP-L-fucose synthase